MKFKNEKQLTEYMKNFYAGKLTIPRMDFYSLLKELGNYNVIIEIELDSYNKNYVYKQFFIINYKNKTLGRLYEDHLYEGHSNDMVMIKSSWYEKPIDENVLKIVYGWISNEQIYEFYQLYHILKIFFEK